MDFKYYEITDIGNKEFKLTPKNLISKTNIYEGDGVIDNVEMAYMYKDYDRFEKWKEQNTLTGYGFEGMKEVSREDVETKQTVTVGEKEIIDAGFTDHYIKLHKYPTRTIAIYSPKHNRCCEKATSSEICDSCKQDIDLINSMYCEEQEKSKTAEEQAKYLYPINSEMSSYEGYIEHSKRHGFVMGAKWQKSQQQEKPKEEAYAAQQLKQYQDKLIEELKDLKYKTEGNLHQRDYNEGIDEAIVAVRSHQLKKE